MGVDSGDTAWVLAAAALVMFMTPGLALFYGGLVRAKNVLGTVMQSLIALGVVTVLWVLVGYSIAFGPDLGMLIGGLDHVGLRGIGAEPIALAPSIPASAFMIFQLMFAVITPALITGAFAERMRFGGYLLFLALWSVLVYAPVAHWVWGRIPGPGRPWGAGFRRWDGRARERWRSRAGGGAVPRAPARLRDRRAAPAQCADDVARSGDPVVRVVRVQRRQRALGRRACLERVRRHPPRRRRRDARMARARAAATRARDDDRCRNGCGGGPRRDHPASGYVAPLPALMIGLVAGLVCFAAVELKGRLALDDSLDVVGVHLVGGIVGALLTGVFASLVVNPAGADGSIAQVGRQAAAVVVTLIFSFAATMAILRLVDRLVGLRVDEQAEEEGWIARNTARAPTCSARASGLPARSRSTPMPSSPSSESSW